MRFFAGPRPNYIPANAAAEQVLDLVAWLLAPQGWTPEKVQAAAEDGKSINVALGKSVPVHFVYLTAFVSENGMVQFRPDIYGRDAPGADDARPPRKTALQAVRGMNDVLPDEASLGSRDGAHPSSTFSVDLNGRANGHKRGLIFDFDGTLDKLVGDQVMAFFGAPLYTKDHPERAVQAALQIIGGMSGLAPSEHLHVGAGIATGEAFVGNVGEGMSQPRLGSPHGPELFDALRSGVSTGGRQP